MTVAYVTEKRSVAEALARVLAAEEAERDAFRGPGVVVTWLAGHVAELAEPGEIRAAWRSWSLDDLPMVPETIPFRVRARGQARFEAAARVVLASEVRTVVCATDAGREGELIFRVFAELAGLRVPVLRLWASSLADAALQRAVATLQPLSNRDHLAAAARARAWADWWLGLNASRALTLVYGRPLSAGRVQTPTLAEVVGRDAERAAHRPAPTVAVELALRPLTSEGAEVPAVVVRRIPVDDDARRFAADAPELAALEAAVGTEAELEALESEEVRTPGPPLFDLDGLQQAAFAAHRFSARQTLDLAQRLYERKLLSYPRTDSTFLTRADAAELPALIEHVAELYGFTTGPPRLQGHVDDDKVGEHPALLPTLTPRPTLKADEQALLELVDRRLLTLAEGPRVQQVAQAFFRVGVHSAFAAGADTISPGWTRFEPQPEPSPLPKLELGDRYEVAAVVTRPDLVPPPKRFDDASLLARMQALGLGTPATRADVLEGLLEKGFLARTEDALVSTLEGRRLVEVCPAVLAEAATTSSLEEGLRAIEDGQRTLGSVTEEARALTEAVVAAIRSPGVPGEPTLGPVRLESARPFPDGPESDALEALLGEGLRSDLIERLTESLGDGPVELLISPWLHSRVVVALGRRLGQVILRRDEPGQNDDDVMGLRGLGVRADRVTDELDDSVRAAAWARYREGRTQLLYLSGPLDPLGREVVAERPPALWVSAGRDTSEEPKGLRLSATANEMAGHRIDEGWGEALALEVERCASRARPSRLRAAVDKSEGATLVWGVTDADVTLAREVLGCASLDQGDPSERRRVLERFLDGRDRVLVSPLFALSSQLALPNLRTVVFMGRPNTMEELALRIRGPSALEDEVRVVVLHDPSERGRVEHTLTQQWPPPETFAHLLKAAPAAKAGLQQASGLERPIFERYWRLGLAHEMLVADGERYHAPPKALGAYHRRRQAVLASATWLEAWLDEVGCRLQLLQRATGSDGPPCGVCDVCDPEGAVVRVFRRPEAAEIASMQDVLRVLDRDGWAPRARLKDVTGPGTDLNSLLEGMVAAGVIVPKLDVNGRRAFTLTIDGRNSANLRFVRIPIRTRARPAR